MSKPIIYQGEFVSQANVVWRVEIWRDSNDSSSALGELRFDANESVLIEWGEVSKEEPLCPSTATIRVISPADGTYQDLYTIKAGSVGAHIYREGQLYWAGTLDAEFYEEPYEMRDSYVVSLTFSDFGMLDRVPLPLRGIVTLQQVLDTAQQCAALERLTLDTSMLSLQYEDGLLYPFGNIAVNADNWRDDTGTYASLKQVLTDMLQPLALRLVSRGGRLYLYDLNGLYTTAQREKIHWMGSSQTLSVDKVVNDCTLTFSPNVENTLLTGEVTYTDPASIGNIDTARNYFKPLRYARNAPPIHDFALFLGAGKGLAFVKDSATYFSLLPLSGGSKDTGVAWSIANPRLKDTTWSEGSVFATAAANADTSPLRVLNSVAAPSFAEVMRSHRVYVPPCSSSDYMLRLTLPILVDVRYNPFHEASPVNETERNDYQYFKVRAGWTFLPIAVNLYDEQGNALMHYTNRGIANSAGIISSLGLGGTWEEGKGDLDDAWLAYYDPKDPVENTALSGWASNRPCIGRPDRPERTFLPLADNNNNHAYDILESFGVGQPIPYPPIGGYIEVVVYEGIAFYDYGALGTRYAYDHSSLRDKVRWMLYKAPKLEIARCYGNFAAAELDDVQHRAVVNPDAREHMSLDLACGTHPETAPSARGLLYYYSRPEGRRSQFGALHTLMRAGDKGSPERLLLNTIFSQFSTRHTKLSGVCALAQHPLSLFTEACQGDRVFIATGLTANLIEDTQEATFVELSPESFRPSNV